MSLRLYVKLLPLSALGLLIAFFINGPLNPFTLYYCIVITTEALILPLLGWWIVDTFIPSLSEIYDNWMIDGQ